jgi:hypothetical protein
MITMKDKPVYPWSADLENSGDVGPRERDVFTMIIGWLELWRLRTRLEPGREACRHFGREQVLVKDRPEWQLDQWSGAIQ